MHTTVNSLKNTLILLVDADSFLAGYVGDSITEARRSGPWPCSHGDKANTLLRRLRQAPHSAVVSADIFEVGGPVMSDVLARLDIPLLLIVGRARTLLPSSMAHKVLMAPFAAYQVVDDLRAVLSFAKRINHPARQPIEAN